MINGDECRAFPRRNDLRAQTRGESIQREKCSLGKKDALEWKDGGISLPCSPCHNLNGDEDVAVKADGDGDLAGGGGGKGGLAPHHGWMNGAYMKDVDRAIQSP